MLVRASRKGIMMALLRDGGALGDGGHNVLWLPQSFVARI